MPSPTRHRRETPSKGDRREQAILDAAEELLATTGLDALTVEAIATRAGITRGAMYFYFASKHDVFSALLDRTMQELDVSTRTASAATDTPPAEAIRQALDDTALLWDQHGAIMRTAVELAGSVPPIRTLWTEALEGSIRSMTDVLLRAGVPDGSEPDNAPALAHALCYMTERTFYWASARHTAVAAASETCAALWVAVLPLDARSDATSIRHPKPDPDSPLDPG